MARKKETVNGVEKLFIDETVAEHVMRVTNPNWSDETRQIFTVGMGAVEKVMCRYFQGEWDRLKIDNVMIRLRKRYYDEYEDPFQSFKGLLTKTGASDISAAKAVDSGIREIIRRNKAKKFKPISAYIPREILKKSSERKKFGSLNS